jgi:RHS repeat-associated protein
LAKASAGNPGQRPIFDVAWQLDKAREWAIGAVAVKPATIPGSGEARVYYYHNDHLGTPKALTDDTQAVVWQADSTPFGTVLETVSTVGNPLRFPGQYFDQETGLHYNYFRDYDPGIGRYTQSDPIGLAGGINTYAYADGNPIRFIDPKGLDLAIPPGDEGEVGSPFPVIIPQSNCEWRCYFATITCGATDGPMVIADFACSVAGYKLCIATLCSELGLCPADGPNLGP